MRRALPCLIALLVLLQLPSGVFAEDKAVTKEAKAKSEFGGSISFEAVYRGDWFEQIWPRSVGTSSQHEGFINGVFSLNATIVPARSVTLFLDLRTRPDPYGFERNRVGDNANSPQFREAWIKVEDLFGKWSDGKGASLQVGLQTFRYDLRGLGRGAFYMDPTNAENPFMGLEGMPIHAGGLPAATYDGANSFLGGNPWYNQLMGMKHSEAGGFKFVLSPHRNAHVDLGAFITMEGGINDVEAGTNVFYFNFDFEFDLNKKSPGLKKEISFEDTSVFNLMISGIQGRRTFIGDGGIGIDLLFNWEAADLEIYAEAHYQNGEYFKTKNDPIFGEDMVPHEAYAAMFGLRIKIKDKSGMHPYLDVSGWFLTGDDGDRHEKSADFMSFESVNDAMILEGDMGLDIDCNYFAVKVELGTHFPGSAKNVELKIFGGFFQLVEAPMAPAVLPTGWDPDEKDLGFEVDGKLIWRVSEGADLFIGAAYLGGAQFFKMMRQTEEETCMMAIAGLNARF